MVSRLCLSHARPASDLVPSQGFRYDESLGSHQINMPYLGMILRLADILDFDRDRTPDSLYRTIDFRSQVSLKEWDKHRSVEGWVIEPTRIQYTMRCEHPEYQRAAYQYMDWIDKELRDAHSLLRSLPSYASKYKLELPLAVDRSRIEAKDEAYIYHNLEFSLSRNEIVKLLMTDKLYNNPQLCIRELLQNSLDALRHRGAMFSRDNAGSRWTQGKVEMGHEVDNDGHEVVWCRDNGSGMDKDIIERFLTTAGRSYYRSPEFEQERVGFSSAGVDFDPCAQFGIGFMSCFMLGDRIDIQTRKDRGPAKGLGDPLIVEINGIGGIVVIRKGKDDQKCGTTVRITGRRKPAFLDELSDVVRLADIVNGHALACEFPIEAVCTIPELKISTSITPGLPMPQTIKEIYDLNLCEIIEFDISSLDDSLNGIMRSGFLIDKQGRFVVKNSEAEWKFRQSPGPRHYLSCRVSEAEPSKLMREGQICVDGILVAGVFGRDNLNPRRNFSYSNPIHTWMHSLIMDIRGSLKPPLTPQRTVPEHTLHFIEDNTKWSKIQRFANIAMGRIWEQAFQRSTSFINHETAWILSAIYGGFVPVMLWMRAKVVWEYLAIPVIDEKHKCNWVRISELDPLEAYHVPNSGTAPRHFVANNFGLRVASSGRQLSLNSLIEFANTNMIVNQQVFISFIVALMSTLVIRNEKVVFEMRRPRVPDLILGDSIIDDIVDMLICIDYEEDLIEYLSIHSDLECVNRRHPVARHVLKSRRNGTITEKDVFFIDVLRLVSSHRTLDGFEASNTRVRRWLKVLGCKYRELDWRIVPTELHPPYKVRTTNGKTHELACFDFERWADSEVLPEE